MTVGDWIQSRAADAPPTLRNAMLSALGPDARAPEEQATGICLAAAARSLASLMAARRFARESALPLLAVDALTTLAFEHASLGNQSLEALAASARAGVEQFGQLIP